MKLREKMKEKEVWQKELAYMSGIAPTTLKMYFQERCGPSAMTLVNIAHALECSIDELADFGEDIGYEI